MTEGFCNPRFIFLDLKNVLFNYLVFLSFMDLHNNHGLFRGIFELILLAKTVSIYHRIYILGKEQ